MPKTSQLQIRISPAQKAILKDLARGAGMTVSEFVLSRALPSHRVDFEAAVDAVRQAPHRERALAELAAFLRGLGPDAFQEATGGGAPSHLPPLIQNYAAATVEREASRRGLDPPSWTREVEAMARPHFAWDLRSLRPHLMRVTPPAFKARRTFIAVPGDPRL